MIVNNVEVGLVDHDGYITISHRGSRNTFTLGKTYQIDNVDCVVESVSPSPYVSGVTNVKLRKI